MSDEDDKVKPLRKLHKTLSGFSSEDLREARQAFEPPRPAKKEDADEVVGSLEAETETRKHFPQGTAVAVAVAQPSASAQEYESLDRMSATADNFMLGLDKVSDVLTILVLKFGRVSKMLQGIPLTRA